MSRSAVIAWIVLPIVAVVFYFTTWRLVPAFFLRAVASEQGVVELGTAVFFAAAAVLAARLASTSTTQIPTVYRALYGLFAVAALFVALEEISYGQHLFGWHSPQFFERHNQQGEVNLHNLMSSKPSKRLHMIADLGTACGFVILPLLLLVGRRTATNDSSILPDSVRRLIVASGETGSWAYYLVPGVQLIALVLLARLVGWLKKIPGAGVDHNELREMLWSWSAFGYIVVMRQRLLHPTGTRGRHE